MKKILVFTFLLISVFSVTKAVGVPRDTVRRKYIGFDANPILSQVLPFNRIGLDANVFAITRRNYWGMNGIRTSYGVGLSDQLSVQFFQFMIGYDRRKAISRRWWYFAGVDMVVRSFSDDQNNGNVTINSTQGFGWGGHWGVEYAVSRVISVSTEANLQLMLVTGTGSPSLLLQPPMNFTAHFNLLGK